MTVQTITVGICKDEGMDIYEIFVSLMCQLFLLKQSREKYVPSENQMFLTLILPVSIFCSIAFTNVLYALMPLALRGW